MLLTSKTSKDLTQFLSINMISICLSLSLSVSEWGMNHKNRTTMVIMNFMHFGRNFMLNYGANEHDFYHYLYQCIREDHLSYLPEIPEKSLKRLKAGA